MPTRALQLKLRLTSRTEPGWQIVLASLKHILTLNLPHRQEKQLLLLEKRQQQFKDAAIEAKRAGQIEQAKEYLRQMKGFDKLIEATKCGLPVDINTLPVPPQDTKGWFEY